MPTFLPGFEAFALAGAIAAAGPVIIHLLNRRRFRVLEWGAMQFLLEALQRNRKILQLRDILLLLLRTAAVLLFGLALARPFFAGSTSEFDPDEKVHAVLAIDNSLSMGYQGALGETLLDEAKSQAKEFIEKLPDGSQVTLIPLCGTAHGASVNTYASLADARDELDRIQLADRSANSKEAASLTLDACDAVPDLLYKRIALLGDQQRTNWPSGAAADWQQLPELQVVDVGPTEPENSWVADLTVQDAIADVETDTKLTAVIRHEGAADRSGVEVTLSVDGGVVASKTVDLKPGQSLPVSFEYRFDVQVEPGRPAWVPAQVSISPDLLPEDDVRYLVVPVVAALPVVFVDQHGAEGEDPDKNIFGETYLLRRLLAPVTSRDELDRHLIDVRHVRVDQLTRETLEDARLVVVAGVPDPVVAVDLLEEYVQQGGNLVVMAGGDSTSEEGTFDPAAWTAAAWDEGRGFLPMPLGELVGQLPSQATEELKPFQLDPKTMKHAFFSLPDEAQQNVADLYREPYFFLAVRADEDAEAVKKLAEVEIEHLAEELLFLAESDENRQRWARLEAEDKLTEEDMSAREEDAARRAEIEPAWLKWDNPQVGDAFSQRPGTEEEAEKLAAEIASRNQPQVLARFDNGVPYVIERGVGRGRVVFFSSGAMPVWNTLATTNAVVLFDRTFRTLLKDTLPERNFGTSREITLPIRARERRGRFEVQAPGEETPRELYVEALRGETYGITLRGVTRRGIYRVSAYPAESAATEGTEAKLWEIPLAINGPEEESSFEPIGEAKLRDRMADVEFRWVNRGEEISLQGAHVSGESLWWWLILTVLLLLLVELSVIAWPTLSSGSSSSEGQVA